MDTNKLASVKTRRFNSGVVAFLAGVVALGSIAMIGITSFTAFNPPGWLRIVTMAPFPFALILAIGLGIDGLKRLSSRAAAIAGLVLAALAVAGFIVILSAGG